MWRVVVLDLITFVCSGTDSPRCTEIIVSHPKLISDTPSYWGQCTGLANGNQRNQTITSTTITVSYSLFPFWEQCMGLIHSVKSTVRKNLYIFPLAFTTLLNRLYGEWTHPCWYLFPLEFTLYFPVYGLYCYFWHDCTLVSDSTWCRNISTVKNIAYRYKHGPWFVLPQYMIDCR